MLIFTSKCLLFSFVESMLTCVLSRTGRMEAKGCAKPAVWKEARRFFYWAVRARLARSEALVQLADSNPEATPELLEKLLDSLVSTVDRSDNRALANALEELDLSSTLVRLRTDYLLQRFLEVAQQDRKASIDGLVRLLDSLSHDERQVLQSALQNTRSPGSLGFFDIPDFIAQ